MDSSLSKPIPQVRIIIPCYNDLEVLRRQLPTFLEALKALPLSWEVVISDDGSREPHPIKAYVESLGAGFIGAPFNQGKGATVRRAMLASRNPYCLFTDADIPFEYAAVAEVIKLLHVDNFDVVVGDRNLPSSSYYAKISLTRYLGSKFFGLLIGRLIGKGWYDTQCGLKGFKGNAARDLFATSQVDRFGFDFEILYLARKKGYSLQRFSVQLRERASESHVRVVRDGLKMMWDIVSVVLRVKRGVYVMEKLSPTKEADKKSKRSNAA